MGVLKKVGRNKRVTYEAMVDDEKKVIFIGDGESPSMVIGFVCDGKWYYQPLIWSCRGGKQKYFRALVTLYRYLRRNEITTHSLRYLAWAENRMKHGGFSIQAGKNRAATA